MQAIALRPARAQLTAQLVALIALCAAMLIAPPLCLPMALVAPLFVCPLVGDRRRWLAFALGLAPAAVSLLNGGEPLYSASLALPCALCVLAVWLQRRCGEDGSDSAYFAYIAAYAAALCMLLLSGSRALGESLCEGLSRRLAEAVGGSSGSGMTLYRLASSGVISVPAEYRSAQLISYMLDPSLKAQLLMSLRLTLKLALGSLIPRLFVECSLALGLFACLRYKKLNHSYMLVRLQGPGTAETPAEAEPQRPSGFGALELPRSAHGAMLIICLASFTLPSASAPLLRMLGTLCEQTFQCAFGLLGAAVVVGLLTARKPELKTVFGVLAAVAFLLAPTLLALVGVLDRLMHFRTRTSSDIEEE